MSITNSLRQGKIGEGHLVQLLTDCGFSCELAPNGKFPDWDVKASKDVQSLTFECKYDIMQAKTKNIAIETYNTKSVKPSGISATKADYWCHILCTSPVEIWIINVKKLKELMEIVKGREISNVGDGNAHIVVYSDKILEEYFFPAHLNSKENILKYLAENVRI